MCRVNPKKIRQPEIFKACWILNPNHEEIRPYRILIKMMSSSSFTENNFYNFITQSPIGYILEVIKSNDFSFNSHYGKHYALRKYLGIEYIILNAYLEKEKIMNNTYSEAEIKSWICCLHNEIKNIHNIKDGTIVYRGFTYRFPSEIGIGSKFYLKEFFFTSQREKDAGRFSQNGTLLAITILNNGTNGFPNYCCDPVEFSEYKYEKEVIITSHCGFIVTNIVHINNKDYISLICEGFLFD